MQSKTQAYSVQKVNDLPVKHSMSKQLRNQINSIPIYYVTIKDTLLIGN